MIKCPNCGSTAQVKVISAHIGCTALNMAEGAIEAKLKCGCGCEFQYVGTLEEAGLLNID